MDSDEDRLSLVQVTGLSRSSCGYCGTGRKRTDTSSSSTSTSSLSSSSVSFGMWAYDLTARAYQDLIDRGWRRSGQYLYKPSIPETCCPAYTIRLNVSGFQCSKGQKKVVKKMRRFVRDGFLGSGVGEADEQDEEDAMHVDDADQGGGGDGMEQFVVPSEPPALDMNVDKATLDQSVVPATVAVNKNQDDNNQKAEGFEEKNAGVHAAVASAAKPTNPSIGTTTTPGSHNDISTEKQPASNPFHRTEKKIKKKKKPDPSTVPASSSFEQLIHQSLYPSDSHKHDIKIVIEPASFTQEVFELYTKYQIAVHHDPPSRITEDQFTHFLVDSPIRTESSPPHPDSTPSSASMTPFPGYGSFHQKYYMDSKLIAVAVIDVLPRCLSSVYFMYNPEYRYLSLGTFSALQEIALTMSWSRVVPQVRYYYMGYYIHSCVKMRYKARYRVSELLCPQSMLWVKMTDDVTALLNQMSAVVLADTSSDARIDASRVHGGGNGTTVQVAKEPRRVVDMDANSVQNAIIANSLVMVNRKLYRLSSFMNRHDMIQSAKELYTRVGPELMSRLVLVIV